MPLLPMTLAAPAAWRATLCAAALTLMALPAMATQLVPANLTRLIGDSDVIVSGRVKALTDGVDAKGIPYTEITLEVGSSAKKKLKPRSEFRFRQYGLLKPRRVADGRTLVARAPEGFPQWQVDEHVVAFMYRPALRTGLRTTVGLGQGKFTSSGGRLVNARFNHGLMSGVQVNPGVLTGAERKVIEQRFGAVDASALMSLVNRAVAGQWIEKGVMR